MCQARAVWASVAAPALRLTQEAAASAAVVREECAETAIHAAVEATREPDAYDENYLARMLVTSLFVLARAAAAAAATAVAATAAAAPPLVHVVEPLAIDRTLEDAALNCDSFEMGVAQNALPVLLKLAVD